MLNKKQYIAITILAIVIGLVVTLTGHSLSYVDFLAGSLCGGIITGLRNA